MSGNAQLNVSGMLYGVGACCGISLATLFVFHFNAGYGRSSDNALTNGRSIKLLYLIAMFDISYYQIKVTQLNSVGIDCGSQEALSVFFYLGSNVLLFCFFLVRYIEMYKFNRGLIPVIVMILVFAAGIPISIVSNKTINQDGGCSVYHPPISTTFPAITSFIVSATMLALFLHPLIWSIRFHFTKQTKKAAQVLFVTNAVGIISTVLFNATLSTTVQEYAPLTSSLDLMINYVMVTLPYLKLRQATVNSERKIGSSVDVPSTSKHVNARSQDRKHRRSMIDMDGHGHAVAVTPPSHTQTGIPTTPICHRISIPIGPHNNNNNHNHNHNHHNTNNGHHTPLASPPPLPTITTTTTTETAPDSTIAAPPLRPLSVESPRGSISGMNSMSPTPHRTHHHHRSDSQVPPLLSPFKSSSTSFTSSSMSMIISPSRHSEIVVPTETMEPTHQSPRQVKIHFDT